MRNKLLVLLLMLVMIFAAAIGFIGCGEKDPDPGPDHSEKIDFEGVELNAKTVTYNGTNLAGQIEVTGAPEGSTITYVYKKNGVAVTEMKDAGEYKVSATVTKDGYNDLELPEVSFVINKADMEGVSAEDVNVNYDGTAKTINVVGLPAGADVSYVYKKDNVEVEEAKAAGVYTVTVTVSLANYNDLEFTKTLTINAIEFTGYGFDDKTVEFDGTAKTIEVTGLPAGASVSYVYKKGNDVVSEAKGVGVYTVEATISHEGYITRTLTATLTINQADYNYDGITLTNGSFVYDGNAKTIAVTGDTTGVSVTYKITKDDVEVTEAVNVGTYKISATLSKDNCKSKTITANLTITKKVLTVGTWKIRGSSPDYSGKAVTPRITGELDTDLTVNFTYMKDGVEVDQIKEVGVYTVTATFTAPDTVNYEVPAPVSVKVTVNPKTLMVLFNGEAGQNGEFQAAYIPAGYAQSLITLSGVAEGETVNTNIDVVYKANESDAGTAHTGAIIEEGIYVITVSISGNANYDLGYENNAQVFEKTITVIVKKAIHNVIFRQEGQADVIRQVKDYDALTDIPEPAKVEGKVYWWEITAGALDCITSDLVIEAASIDVEQINDTEVAMTDVKDLSAGVNLTAVIGTENLAKIEAFDESGALGTGKYYLIDAYGTKTEVADITSVDLTDLAVYSTYTLTREYVYEGLDITVYTKALDIYNSASAPVWNNVVDSLAMVESIDFGNRKLANEDWVEVDTVGGIKYYKITVDATGVENVYSYYNFVLKPLHTKEYYELYRDQGYTFNFSIKVLNSNKGGVVGQAYAGTTKNLGEVLKANTFDTITYTLEDVLDKKWDLLTDPVTYGLTHKNDKDQATTAYTYYKTDKGYGLLSIIGSSTVSQSFWLGQFFMTNGTLPSYTDDTVQSAVDTNGTALDLTQYISSENKTNIDDVLNKGYSAIYRLTSVTGKTVLGKTIDSSLEENRQIWTIEIIVGTTVIYKGQVDVRNTDDATAKWASITGEESVANAFVHGKPNGSGTTFVIPTYEEFMGRKALKTDLVPNKIWATHFSFKPLHTKEYYEKFKDQGYKFSFEYYVDCDAEKRAFEQAYTLATTTGVGMIYPGNKTWHKVTVSLETLLEKWDNIFVNYENEVWGNRANVFAMLYWYANNQAGSVYVAGFDLYKDTATVTVENYYEKDFNTGVYEIDSDKTTTYEYGVGYDAFYQVSDKTGYELDLSVAETVTHGTVTAEGLTLKLYYKIKPAYTVEYYTENGYGTNDFTKVDTKKYYSAAGTKVNADTSIVYENYSVDLTAGELSGTVEGNMTLVLKVYYKLKPTYTVEYYKQNSFGTDEYTIDSELTKTLYAALNETINLTTPSAPANYAFNASKSVLSGTVDGNGTLVLRVYFDLTANIIGMIDKKDTTTITVVNDASAEYTYQLFRIVDGKEIEVENASGLFANGTIDISTLEGQYKVVATDNATSTTITSAFEAYDSTSGYVWNEPNLADMVIGVDGGDAYTGTAITAKEFTIVDGVTADAVTDALIAGTNAKFAKISFDETATKANIYMNLARLHSEDYYKQLAGKGYVVSFKIYSSVKVSRCAFVGYGGYSGNTKGYFMDKINNGRAQNAINAGSYDIISLPFDSLLLSAENQVSSIGKVLANGLPKTNGSWNFANQMVSIEITSGLAGATVYIGDFVIEQVPDVVLQDEKNTISVNLNGQSSFDLRDILDANQREKYDYIVNKYDGQPSYSWAKRALIWTIKTGNGKTITVNGTKDSPAMLDVAGNIEDLMSSGTASVTASIRGMSNGATDGYAYPSNIVILSKVSFSNFPELKTVTTNYYLEQEDGSFVIDESRTTSSQKVVGSSVAAEILIIDGYYLDLGNENGNLAGTLTAEGLTLSVYYKIGTYPDRLVDVKGLDSYDLKSAFAQSLNALAEAGLKIDTVVTDANGAAIDSVIDVTNTYAVGAYTISFTYGTTVIYSEIVDIYNSDAAPMWDYAEGSNNRLSRAQAIDWNGKKVLTGDEWIRIEKVQGIDYYAMTVPGGSKAGTYNYQMFGLKPIHTKAYYEMFRDKGYTFSYAFKGVVADGSNPGGQVYLGTADNKAGVVKNNAWTTVSFTLEEVLDNWDKFTDTLTKYKADGTPWGAKGYGLYSITGKDLIDQVFYVGQFFISNEELPTYTDDTVYTVVDSNTTEYDFSQNISTENRDNISALAAKYDFVVRLVDVNGNICSDTAIDTTIEENRKLWRLEIVIGPTIVYTGYIDIYNTTDNAYWNEITGEESVNAAFARGNTKGTVALTPTYEEINDENLGTVKVLKLPNYSGSDIYNNHISLKGIHSKEFYEMFRGQGYYFSYSFYVNSDATSKLMNQGLTLASTGGMQYFENKTWHNVTVSFDTLLDKWDNIFVNYGEEEWGTRTNIYAMLYWNTASNSNDPVYVAGFEIFKADVANVTTEVYLETEAGSGEFAKESSRTEKAIAPVGATIYANIHKTITKNVTGSDGASVSKTYTYSADNSNNVISGEVTADGLTLKIYYTMNATA